MSVAKKPIADKDWMQGKDPRMEVMSAAPLVLSTPVGLLGESRITDKKILFVRNIQDMVEGMAMEPIPLQGWEIELTGLIRPNRIVIKAEDLPKMEQVESVDKGRSWQSAELEIPDSPYAWYPWKAKVTLAPGSYEIWARATDALGRSQPLDGKIFWNPSGYEWTGVFKNKVSVR